RPGVALFQSIGSGCLLQNPSFLKDLDGDGLLDFACMDFGTNTPCLARSSGGPSQGIGFGHGGGFSIFSSYFDTSPVNVRGQQFNLGGTSQIAVFGPAGTRVAQDYLDLNGDGIAERYYLNTPADPQLHVDLWTPEAAGTAPPGLLETVRNGVG